MNTNAVSDDELLAIAELYFYTIMPDESRIEEIKKDKKLKPEAKETLLSRSEGGTPNFILKGAEKQGRGYSLHIIAYDKKPEDFLGLEDKLRSFFTQQEIYIAGFETKEVGIRKFIDQIEYWEKTLERPLGYKIGDTSNTEKYAKTLLKIVEELEASDIHIEPDPRSNKDGGIIRVRVDGNLRILNNFSLDVLENLTGYFHNKIEEKQTNNNKLNFEGSFQGGHDNKTKYRVSSILTNSCSTGTSSTEKKLYSLVIRVLKTRDIEHTLEGLNYLKDHREQVDSFLRQKNGVLVLTGYTGTGKTTTIGCLITEIAAKMNNYGKKFLTLEDPREYHIDGASQIQVTTEENEYGLPLRQAIKGCLRQDPDGIMVGEARDANTAKYIFDLALTGHLILTTMHATDTIGALTRLTGFGVPGPTLNNTLLGVISQNLLKTNCPDCKEERDLATEELDYFFPTLSKENRLEELGQLPKVAYSTGKVDGNTCPKCEGFKSYGRIPIVEIYAHDKNPSREISDMCKEDPDAPIKLKKLFLEGVHKPFVVNALQHMFNGTISPQEVKDVLPDTDFKYYEPLLITEMPNLVKKEQPKPVM